MVPSGILLLSTAQMHSPVAAPLVGIWGIRQRLWLRPQGGSQFGEGPRYDVQVAVHRPQLRQDVTDICFQTRRSSRWGAGRWGGSRVFSTLLSAPCGPARGAALLRALDRRQPLSLIRPEARRGGRGAARQPVKEARGSLRGGGNDRVEACAPCGAGAGKGSGKRLLQQRGQHRGTRRKRRGFTGGGGGRQGSGGGAWLLRREEQGGRRLGVQGTGL